MYTLKNANKEIIASGDIDVIRGYLLNTTPKVSNEKINNYIRIANLQGFATILSNKLILIKNE